MAAICALGDVMKESAQIALNWIRSNDQQVSECHCIVTQLHECVGICTDM